MRETRKTFSKSGEKFLAAQNRQLQLDLQKENNEEERRKIIKESLSKIKELKKNNRQKSKEIIVT